MHTLIYSNLGLLDQPGSHCFQLKPINLLLKTSLNLPWIKQVLEVF